MAVTGAALVRALVEVIAAIDRRVPRVGRAAEPSIAREAKALRDKASKRLAELGEETVSAPPARRPG